MNRAVRTQRHVLHEAGPPAPQHGEDWRGQVPELDALHPGDVGYGEAAQVFAATGKPAVVVRPHSAEEVGAALAEAVHRDLVVAIRSGGHGLAGQGTNDGGMVIDLAFLNGVRVLEASRRLVRIGGGATWGKVAAELDAHGWGLTAGDTADVGVGGLTLGGGIGWMVRRYGLAIDNLVGARLVTADGRLLCASEHEHAELFWALRGGGGNFGVVVDFDFVAQPVSTVHFGSVAYAFDDPALLSRWRDAMRVAPEELSSTLALPPTAPGATPTAIVLLCYAGEAGASAAAADAAIKPLLDLGTVIATSIAERRYTEILESAARPPAGLRMVARDTLVRSLDDDVLAAVEQVRQAPPPGAIALRSLGGAVARVPSDATAYAHRDAEAMIVSFSMMPDTASDAEVEQALVPWQSVAAHGVGTYTNFQGSTTAEDVAAAYPPATYARLARVKRAYDPGNLFRSNHNVEPEVQRSDELVVTGDRR